MSDLLARAHQRLHPVSGLAFVTFASEGCEAAAAVAAARAERTWDWVSRWCPPAFERPAIFMLTAADWNEFAPVPIYGMPQAWSDRLVVAATGGGTWDEFLIALDTELDDAGLRRVQAVYGETARVPELFEPLVTAHETTHFFHAFSDAGAVGLARLWVGELFANLGLYSYVVEHEPDALPALMTVCELTGKAALPWSKFPIAEMGGGSVSGYTDAQLRLIVYARAIWESIGPDAFALFHDRLRDPAMSDAEIMRVLDEIAPTDLLP